MANCQHALATLYVSGNNDQLSWFSDLQEASELYESEIGTYHYLYPDLEDLDLERCIIEECKLYLGFQAVQCEPHRFQDIYCKDCNQWGLPLPKRPIAGLIKRMIGFFGKHQEKNTNKQCQNCGSKDLLEIYSLESRLQYLEYLRKKS